MQRLFSIIASHAFAIRERRLYEGDVDADEEVAQVAIAFDKLMRVLARFLKTPTCEDARDLTKWPMIFHGLLKRALETHDTVEQLRGTFDTVVGIMAGIPRLIPSNDNSTESNEKQGA